MELEVREIPPQSRGMYSSRMRSYKQEMEKLEADFVSKFICGILHKKAYGGATSLLQCNAFYLRMYPMPCSESQEHKIQQQKPK